MCCTASSLGLCRLADTALGSGWCSSEPSVRFHWYFCAIYVHFPSLESLGHCESCGVVQHSNFLYCKIVSHTWHFFVRNGRRFLWAKAKGGLLEEAYGRKLSWAQSHPCCLLREVWVTDSLLKLCLGGASESANWWPLGKAKKWMEAQRSNTQFFSLALSFSSMCLKDTTWK